VYDVEEHFLVAMRLTNNVIYTWERGAHANVEVPNETRIYGTRGGVKLAYCTWDAPTITSYGFDSKGMAKEEKITIDMKDHPNDGYALVDHFLRVLDGEEPPVISLELAKKHMDIIHKCAHFADNSLL
jgi:predicted dehydrogenase